MNRLISFKITLISLTHKCISEIKSLNFLQLGVIAKNIPSDVLKVKLEEFINDCN